MKIIQEEILKRKTDAAVSADIAAGRVGCAVLRVTQNGRVVYDGRFGKTADGTVPDAHTLFRMASMTKPVTAAAVLIEMSRGHLSADDPVSRYLPGYKHMKTARLTNGKIEETGEARTELTLRHLLTHTGGVGSEELGAVQFAGLTEAEKSSVSAVAEAFAQLPLAFEPFTRQAYSPLAAFDVLAAVIERTSDMSYPDYVRKNIFLPLEMNDSTFSPTPAEWSRTVPMHTCDGGAAYVPFPQRNPFGDYPASYTSGGAGLLSSLDDYCKFARMLLAEGRTEEGEPIVPDRYIRMMRTPQVPRSIMPGPVSWGLGVRVITSDAYQALPRSCFGWSGAFGTHFWVDPDDRVTAVYLKNSLYDGGAGSLTGRIFEENVTASLAE